MEKEKNPYMISIVGEQKVEGQDDRIEVITEGKYMMKNGYFLINYKEYDEDLPDKFLNNLVKVENETVTISRKGPLSSQLILEKGKRHQCMYQTIAGTLSIGVFTKTLNNNLNENGGSLEVIYTLDFNSDLVSENRFKIDIEKKKEVENNEHLC
ncbi:DUF1934 domain-containing protein [Ruminococcus sp.]|uniref:DUF1934 domain-containing protein n=1 Tax=Ruminococcus sp. TaxID=41978 RepID=UPI0040266937